MSRVKIHRKTPDGYEQVTVDAQTDHRVRQNRDGTWAIRSKAQAKGWVLGRSPDDKAKEPAPEPVMSESVTTKLDISEDLLDVGRKPSAEDTLPAEGEEE